jgi:hypothetical protein
LTVGALRGELLLQREYQSPFETEFLAHTSGRFNSFAPTLIGLCIAADPVPFASNMSW